MTYSSFDSYFSSGWQFVKELLKASEPYQPFVAGCLILGKLAWRIYKQKPLVREVQSLERRIAVVSGLIRSMTEEDRPVLPQTRERLRALKADLAEKKRQLSYTYLTFSQIPSLFFSHPGANIYQSLHQMVGRGVLMHHAAHPVRPNESVHSFKKIATLAGGLISLAGTAASLARMTGAVDANNQNSHYLSGAAILFHTLEGALIVKETVVNYLRSFRQDHAQQVR